MGIYNSFENWPSISTTVPLAAMFSTPQKKKTKTETKRNKNLQDFSRSEYISFTILIVTLNIMKSDFTSFIEANIYIQTGEHSGVRVICDYCKTQQNPSLEGGS